MYDAIIIGSGPAGISASLYLKRAGMNTLVLTKGNGALEKTEKIENYYGFEEPIKGQDLQKKGEEQAKRLGVIIETEEVLAIEKQKYFEVQTANSSYRSSVVIIATGTSRKSPNIKGLKEFEGKGVSYCAICDAFFYRNKKVAVLGSGNYAIHEAMQLLPIVKSVTMLTNGEPIVENRSIELPVIEKKIKEIRGDNSIKEIAFEDKTQKEISGIFIAIGTASSSDLARKIGAIVKGNNIVVDEKMKTNVQGLFACGDCTGGLLQISKAVYEGTKAGLEAVKYIREIKKR